MLEAILGPRERGPLTILALGAHPDDIEIGCGGTILELVESRPDTRISWIVLSGAGTRAAEARRSAETFLPSSVERRISVEQFRDGFFPYSGPDVKDYFEGLKEDVEPDVILTHHRQDLHQDHRLVAELTWNTFRDHLILEYEIPKYDGDLGSPNVFVPLSEGAVRRKIDHVVTHFETQADRRWFTDDLFVSILRLRGMECNSPSGHAEAFYCRKLVLRSSGAWPA